MQDLLIIHDVSKCQTARNDSCASEQLQIEPRQIVLFFPEITSLPKCPMFQNPFADDFIILCLDCHSPSLLSSCVGHVFFSNNNPHISRIVSQACVCVFFIEASLVLH